jgi:hypothetical protein
VLNPATSETKVSRRSRGEDAIYFAAAKNRYVGSVSLGYGPDGKRIRRKVFGKTKQEVRDRLKALHQELNSGVRSSSNYTVRQTVEDWLREGLDGTSERTRTLYEGLLGPLLEMIGARQLRDLTAGDVRSALGKLVTRYSTRSLQITRNSLERAIRHAQGDDLVGRNVAALVKSPRGRTGAKRAPDERRGLHLLRHLYRPERRYRRRSHRPGLDSRPPRLPRTYPPHTFGH